MTADGKLLKISCIASLFAGIATVVLGIVLFAATMTDMDALVTACDGLLATVFGARCAILANVPSNTAKIRGKALIFLAAAAAVVAFLVFGGQDVVTLQYATAGFLCGLALVALALAQRIVKEQLRK